MFTNLLDGAEVKEYFDSLQLSDDIWVKLNNELVRLSIMTRKSPKVHFKKVRRSNVAHCEKLLSALRVLDSAPMPFIKGALDAQFGEPRKSDYLQGTLSSFWLSITSTIELLEIHKKYLEGTESHYLSARALVGGELPKLYQETTKKKYGRAYKSNQELYEANGIEFSMMCLRALGWPDPQRNTVSVHFQDYKREMKLRDKTTHQK